MKNDCPKEKANVRESKHFAPSDVEDSSPKSNRFYPLQSKGDQE